MNTLKTSPRRAVSGGFSLVEIMIVLAIIALLSALAVPALKRARTNTLRVRLVKELKNTEEGVETYAAENLKLPLETNSSSMVISAQYVPPPGLDSYLPKNSTWKNGTNGTWYWVYWPTAMPPYKGFIYLVDPDIDDSDIAFIDKQLDDGNPATGSIINYGGGQVLYFVK